MDGDQLTSPFAKRVVITGVGVITSIGQTAESFWQSLLAGKSGISKLEKFPIEAYPTHIAAEIKEWDPSVYMDKKDARRMDRFVQFSAAGARQAVDDAKLGIDESNATRVGVCIGSGIGGLGTLEEQHIILNERGPGRVSPFLIPGIISDMCAGYVSIMLGAKGPNLCITTACATGNHSIGEATRIIQRGDADVMITGGAEAPLTPLGMAGFCAARTMSTRNDEPQRASRPFEQGRDGFVMGEGAGILVLETYDSAVARGAHIYAEVVGYGASGDAYHITAPAPEGEGAARSMLAALASGGLTPNDVDYINAHGTSTELNDKNETAAIKTVFGDRAYKLPISSTKSMTGHLLGAAGAIEAVASAMAIRDNRVPPTINYEVPDPNCDLDYVPNVARDCKVDIVMSNSFGFGGHNATVIIKRV